MLAAFFLDCLFLFFPHLRYHTYILYIVNQINNQNIHNNPNIENPQINQNINMGPACPPLNKEKALVDESFSIDFSDAYEKGMLSSRNNINETILEQKLRKNKQDNNFENSFFILNYEDFKGIENDFKVNKNNRKKEDFLQVRNFPQLVEKEYQNIVLKERLLFVGAAFRRKKALQN